MPITTTTSTNQNTTCLMSSSYHHDPSSIGLYGSLLSLIAGGMIGLGHGLLFDTEFKKETIVRRSIGGATFMFGLYIASPSFLRRFWLLH